MKETQDLNELSMWDFYGRYDGQQSIWPVSLWLIQRGEVEIIVHLSQQLPKVEGKRLLLDLKPGSGLIARLFAETGAFDHVIVVPGEANAELRFSHPAVEVATGSYPQVAERHAGKITALICSWMGPEENLTPLIHQIGPHLIVYVRDKTGMCGGIVGRKDGPVEPFDPGLSYQVICCWDAPSHFCLKPRLEKTYSVYDSIEQSEIEIQLRKDLVDRVCGVKLAEGLGAYPWEPFPGSSLRPIWIPRDRRGRFSQTEAVHIVRGGKNNPAPTLEDGRWGSRCALPDERVPFIQTELPGPQARKIIEKDEQYTSPSYTRGYPLVIHRAQGMTIEDPDENRFLDFAAAIAVATTGHCHPTVVKVIQEAATRFLHFSSVDHYHQPQADLAERLAELAPGSDAKRVFFAASGAEAVEAAFKLVRYRSRKPRMISFLGAFHGRTLGAVSLSASKAVHRRYYAPLVPEVTHVPYPYCFRCPFGLNPEGCELACVRYIEEVVFERIAPPEEVAAIIVEPIQGEGGYIVPPPRFHRALQELAHKHEILLICDEIQAGMGRTGRMFCINHWDVVPDIITLGKGIASGMPLAATIAPASLMTWEANSHASTFGGNPISCLAALETLRLVEEGLMANAWAMGEMLLAGLRELQERHRIVGDVRGMGLMVGMELVKDKMNPGKNPEDRDSIVQGCFRRGLVVRECGDNSIRLSPPLIVSRKEITVALEILDEVLTQVEEKSQ